MARNITAKEWVDGELVDTGDPVTVNGKLPGSGGDGLWSEQADGSVTPASGQPVESGEINNKVTVAPGENIQQALNDAQPSNSWGYSHVSLKPGYGSEGVVHDLPDAELPITVPSQTVFDIRGAYIDSLDGTGDLFNLSARTYVLGEGAAIRPPAGSVFVVDTGVVGPVGTKEPLYVSGYPHVIGSNGGNYVVDYRQNTADALTGCYITAYLHNGKSPARFSSTDATGYCSGNIADVHGKTIADANDAQSLFVFEGGGDIHHNAGVISEVLQVSGGDYLAEFTSGYENVVTDHKSGYVADPQNAVSGIVLTDTNAGPRNRAEFDYNWSWSDWTDNSAELQYVGRGGGMWLAQNLAGKSGYSDGFSAVDNGTNTTSTLPEICVWDTSNTQWHSMGGDTFV